MSNSIHSKRSSSILTSLRPWRVLPLAGVLLAGSAAAFITGVSGMAVLIAAPASVQPGALVDSAINSFNEQHAVLPFDIQLDAPAGSQLTAVGDLAPLIIPQGTCVKSHYVNYEPGAGASASGSLRFDQPILGVAVLQATLSATDFLGAPGTNYPTPLLCAGAPGVDCGLELGADRVRVNAQTIEVDFDAGSPGDRLRVVTRGNPANCRPLCHDEQCR